MSAPIAQMYFNVNRTKMIIQRAMLSLRRLQLLTSCNLINRISSSNTIHHSSFYKSDFENGTKTGISTHISSTNGCFNSTIRKFSGHNSRLRNALISHCRSQHQSKRNNSSNPDDDFNEDRQDDSRHKLKLMDFPFLMWPNLLKKLQSFLWSGVIGAFFDTNFSTKNFMQDAVQAVTFASKNISKGQFSALEGLVTHEALSEIRRNYADLNAKQKSKLAVIAEDIFLKFIYEIKLIFKDETNQRFVEITVVLQGFHGRLEQSKPENVADHFRQVSENRDQVYVCNYRFIREFTKGVEDDWVINKLNHFLHIEQNKTRY